MASKNTRRFGGLRGAVAVEAAAAIRPVRDPQLPAFLLAVQLPVAAVLIQPVHQALGMPGQLYRVQQPRLLQQVGLHPAAQLIDDLIRELIHGAGHHARVPRRHLPDPHRLRGVRVQRRQLAGE